MGSLTVSPDPASRAQQVGLAFVEQYYCILHQLPESVNKFYEDSSVISRPEPNGVMSSVTTIQAINDKILCLDYKNITAEIRTADAQESHGGGVIVVVTGCMTGIDNMRRPFSQSFFLAPTDKGYFVLNDIFRYMDQSDAMEAMFTVASSVSENGPKAPRTPEPEPAQAMTRHAIDPKTSISEEYLNNGAEVCDPSDNTEASVGEEEVEDTATHSSQNDVQQVRSTFSVQDDLSDNGKSSVDEEEVEDTATHSSQNDTQLVSSTFSVQDDPSDNGQSSIGEEEVGDITAHSSQNDTQEVSSIVSVQDNPSNNGGSSVAEKVVADAAAHSSQNDTQEGSSTSSVQDDAPKKSFAEIVKLMRTTNPALVHAPTTTVWAAPAKPKKQSVVSPVPATEPEIRAAGNNGVHESRSHHEEAGSRSIYIRGLPLNAEVTQVVKEFKKFGPIKPGGVLVRSNKEKGFCFGFVEYVSSSSVHSAVEASPVMIGGRRAFVEKKRNQSFQANGGGGGWFSSPSAPRRGGSLNDYFRGFSQPGSWEK